MSAIVWNIEIAVAVWEVDLGGRSWTSQLVYLLGRGWGRNWEPNSKKPAQICVSNVICILIRHHKKSLPLS